MSTYRPLSLMVCLFWLVVGPCPMALAQHSGWVLQNFDGDICGLFSTAPVTLTYDPTQDNTGDGGGSCHVSAPLAAGGFFDINVSYINCCNCDLQILLYLSNYASVNFDLKWDNTATVSPAQFNTGFDGAPGGLVISGCSSPVLIPDAATNGWVHITALVDPTSTYATNRSTGITLTSTFSAAGLPPGKLAFWIDNIQLGVLPPQMIPVTTTYGSNRFTVQWRAPAGDTCTVFKSTDLRVWTALVTGYPLGGLTNGLGSYTDINATNPRSFYRVSVP